MDDKTHSPTRDIMGGSIRELTMLERSTDVITRKIMEAETDKFAYNEELKFLEQNQTIVRVVEILKRHRII